MKFSFCFVDYLCLYLGGTNPVWQGVDFCIEPFPPTRHTPSVSYKFSQECQSIALWDVYFLYFHLFKKINNYPYHARSMWKSDALCIFQTDKLILLIAGDWAFTLNPHTITLTAYMFIWFLQKKRRRRWVLLIKLTITPDFSSLSCLLSSIWFSGPATSYQMKKGHLGCDHYYSLAANNTHIIPTMQCPDSI